MNAEQALVANRVVKAFSLWELGEGRNHCCGGDGKQASQPVIDRLPRLADGISAAQRNDFGWFEEAWDGKTIEQHDVGWPARFASWAQRLLDAHAQGDRAAFS